MSKNRKIKKKKVQSVLKRRIKFGLKVTLLIILLMLLITGTVFYIMYGRSVFKMQSEAKALVRESTVDTFRQTETSLVYDANGKLLARLKGEKDVYYINYEDIPDYVKEAMISIEDKKFETHMGVDIKANLRAVTALIKNKGEVTQGASTITQQLSRTVFLTNEVSWKRKVKEIFIAMELEKKYPKYQILEFYLNNIYFGNGYYGIQAASKGYFSKGVDELNLSQIAFLCAIPNNPTLYDPTEKMENTLGRRDRILKQMLNDGKIDSVEYEEAKAETITLKETSFAKKNYIETYVYSCAIEALMKEQGFLMRDTFADLDDKKEYEDSFNELYTQCQQSLYRNGYRIYTSIDVTKQKELQASVDENLDKFQEKSDEGIYEMQGSAVCIDNETGRVVAIVGGRTQDAKGYTLNRAFQSYRQPGSAIKPLIVYTPAFQMSYTPSTVVEDKKIKDGPENSNGRYSGKLTVRKAVEQSKNTVAYNLFEEINPIVGISYLLNMHFSNIDRNDYLPTAALGGFTYGVSAVEMASGYATIENDGIFRDPTCIVKIMDTKGEEVIKENIDATTIYEQNAARMMTDVLVGVIEKGTGKGLALDNMKAAGKTGTTNEHKDGWFVGYTPYYTTSVWVGYDIPKEVKNLTGSTYPGQIWKQFMNIIHKDLENLEFPKYQDYKNSDSEDSLEAGMANEKEEAEDQADAKEEAEVEEAEEEVVEDDIVEPEVPDEEVVETEAPTQTPDPVVSPTQAPTIAPTAVPTVEPAVDPVNVPVSTP